MSKHKPRDHVQYAALPFRMGADGRPQILLLTSRETKRWVIPKGWPMRGKKPREVATQEAFEEAGLVGKLIGKRPVGNFHYTKELPSGESVLCQVKVFPLRVEQQLDDWPEREQRETRWFGAIDAAALVEEGGLAEILRHAMGLVTGAVVTPLAVVHQTSATKDRNRVKAARSSRAARRPGGAGA